MSRLRVAHAALVDAAAQFLAAGDAPAEGAPMHAAETSARLRAMAEGFPKSRGCRDEAE